MKSFWSILKSGMHTSCVVVDNLPVYSEYKMLNGLIFLSISEFQFELPVIRFLCSILPGWSLMTHRNSDLLFAEKIKHQITGIFRSLIWMKKLWDDSACLFYCILYSGEDKFFRMSVTESISNNLLCIVIKYCCKIEMDSFIDDVCKITPPDDMWRYRAERFEKVHNLRISSRRSNAMHIFCVLIVFFNKTSSLLLFGNDAKLSHKTPCFTHTPSSCPSKTSMTIPRMFFVNIGNYLSFFFITYRYTWLVGYTGSCNTKKRVEMWCCNTPKCTKFISSFLFYISDQIGLLHLFFSSVQPQHWTLLQSE